MSFVTWTEDLSVGVDALDEDHRELIGIFNEVLETKQNNTKREDLLGLLDRLVDYTRFHFSREEALMRKRNYPDLDAHKAQHDGFIHRIIDLKRQYEAGSALMLRIDLVITLNDWLIDHIRNTDMDYRPYMAVPNDVRPPRPAP